MDNLLLLEIPDRCRRFSERVGPGYLPFIAAAVVLAAVQALPADRRRLIRGHIQELRRRHRDDAPVELALVLRLLADVARDADRVRRDREDRFRRERSQRAALAERRRQRALEELLAFDGSDDASLVPGLVQVELTPKQWETLV